MKTANRNRKIIKAAVIMTAVIAIAILIWWGNVSVVTDEFRIYGAPSSFSGFRIAHVSDLHNASFGEENSELLRLINEAEPDIIVITGDLIDSNRTDIGVAVSFADEASKLAPIYYVNGNHEAVIPRAEYERLKTGLSAIGVTVLENSSVEITRGDDKIRLIGINDPSFASDTEPRELAAGDIYTVLLAHRPEYYDDYVSADVDLVFSGHAHGGQFRLPFIGGLIAPGQGFFPKYDSGLYESGNTHMIVSRGLGNSIIPVRINNRPELIIAELRAK